MTRSILVALILSLGLALARPAAALAEDIIHTVEPGENLFRIGLRYGVSWQVLMAANGLSSTQIYVGQKLRVPSGGSVDTRVLAPAQSAGPGPAATTYSVVRGDTLASIARKHGVTPQSLAAANNIFDPNRIYAGQVLRIPDASGAAVAGGSGSTAGPKLIVVDISEQRMYVHQGGGLIWSWVVSTGERGRDTVPGSYSVLNKIPTAYASTWNLQMPYWLGIYWAGRLQNGIHALPILPNGQQLWAGWLGTPVSYGCVILGTSEAQTLFQWAEVGTPVKIRW